MYQQLGDIEGCAFTRHDSHRDHHVVLTGVTGLIGRHVLYEFLGRIMSGLMRGHLYVLVRSTPRHTAAARLRDLFAAPSLPTFLHDFDPADLLAHVTVIDTDLAADDARARLRQALPARRFYHVIHMAASTNLANTPAAEDDVHRHNYLGTRRLIDALHFHHFKFTFVSTAFACGSRPGHITDDFHASADASVTPDFRNPYERTKHRLEHELAALCADLAIPFQVLRPSVTCGRLHDTPLHYTSKFDVFYGFGKFFWKLRHHRPEVRIQVNLSGGLNIIPVDQVALAIVNAYAADIPRLNLVSARSVAHADYITTILGAIGGCRFHLQEEPVTAPTRWEQLYYKSVGNAFQPYVTCPAHTFDTTALRAFLPRPEVSVSAHMPGLVDFAIRHDFESPAAAPSPTVLQSAS